MWPVTVQIMRTKNTSAASVIQAISYDCIYPCFLFCLVFFPKCLLKRYIQAFRASSQFVRLSVV